MRRLPSSSTLIALLALFVALGGTAYAVSQAPRNSVTGKSVRNGSLTGSDLKRDSLGGKQIRESSLRTGALDLRRPVPSGQTMRGTFVIRWGSGGDPSDAYADSVDFLARFSRELDAHYVEQGDSPPPGCNGSAAQPAAQPGNFCAYESEAFSRDSGFVSGADSQGDRTDRSGAAITVIAEGSNGGAVFGTWAATAP